MQHYERAHTELLEGDSLYRHPEGWKSSQPERVVFSVEPYHQDEDTTSYQLEPIAIVRAGRFLQPPWAKQSTDSPASLQFAHRYFQARRSYPVYCAGRKIGLASISGTVPFSCTGIAGSARMDSLPGFPADAILLATSDARYHGDSTSFRTPNASDSLELAQIASRIYRNHGVLPGPFSGVRVTDARSLGGGGSPRLTFACFSVRSTRADRVLFLVAEGAGGGLKPVIAHYSVVRDLDDYMDAKLESVIGAMDLDGDGIPELVLNISGYESLSYEIFKKTLRGWRRIYSGGGAGC